MGSFFSTVSDLTSQSFPPKARFSADDIPDLTGKVVLVTGGNSGLGRETCRALLRKNAKVYLAARSPSKAEAALKDLKETTGKDAIFLKLDLADLKSIRASAEEFQSKESELHILFNNGGVMATPMDQLTADGYDLQFGTNVLGHFYLTKLLLPIMTATAKNSPPNTVRIVHTSSGAHVFLKSVDFDSLYEGHDGKNKKRYKLGKNMLYAQSKFGNVVFARELARRYADQGIVSMSCNPGNLKTELQRHVGAMIVLMNLMLYPAPMGALTQLYAGTSPEAGSANGGYFIPWARSGKAGSATDDPELGKKLWEWCEEQVKDIS